MGRLREIDLEKASISTKTNRTLKLIRNILNDKHKLTLPKKTRIIVQRNPLQFCKGMISKIKGNMTRNNLVACGAYLWKVCTFQRGFRNVERVYKLNSNCEGYAYAKLKMTKLSKLNGILSGYSLSILFLRLYREFVL